MIRRFAWLLLLTVAAPMATAFAAPPETAAVAAAALSAVQPAQPGPALLSASVGAVGSGQPESVGCTRAGLSFVCPHVVADQATGAVGERSAVFYRVVLLAGLSYLVTLESGDGDADLALFSPSREYIVGGHQPGGDQIQFSPPATGRYYLMVTGHQEARYALRVATLEPNAVALNPAQTVLPVEGRLQYHAAVRFPNGTGEDRTVGATWRTEDSSVATVDRTGRVQAVAPGKTAVVAAYGPVVGRADVIVEPVTGLAVDTSYVVLGTGMQQSLSLDVVGEEGPWATVTDLATWSSANPNVATVKAGVVTGVGPGTAEIRAAFAGKTATALITVKPIARLEVLPVEGVVKQYHKLRLSARVIYADGTSADVTDRVAWSTNNKYYCAVFDGSLSAYQREACTVEATLADHRAAVPVPIIWVQKVDLNPGRLSLDIGQTTQVRLTAIWNNGEEEADPIGVHWQSNDVGVAVVSDTGVVTGVGSGQTSVIAMYGGWGILVTVNVTP